VCVCVGVGMGMCVCACVCVCVEGQTKEDAGLRNPGDACTNQLSIGGEAAAQGTHDNLAN
jgi:hypothetical protein